MLFLPLDRSRAHQIIARDELAIFVVDGGLVAREEVALPERVIDPLHPARAEAAAQVRSLALLRERAVVALLLHSPLLHRLHP